MLLLPLHGKHSMLKDALLHNCDARAKIVERIFISFLGAAAKQLSAWDDLNSSLFPSVSKILRSLLKPYAMMFVNSSEPTMLPFFH